MKRIFLSYTIAACLVLSAGISFVATADESAKEGEEMIPVSRVVDEGTEEAAKGAEMMKEDADMAKEHEAEEAGKELEEETEK